MFALTVKLFWSLVRELGIEKLQRVCDKSKGVEESDEGTKKRSDDGRIVSKQYAKMTCLHGRKKVCQVGACICICIDSSPEFANVNYHLVWIVPLGSVAS
jgi:hypothetical protein